jgi:predicted alpha/beta hydrolase family esterase
MIYWADVMYASSAGSEEAHESLGDEVSTCEADDTGTWRDALTSEESTIVDRLASRLDFDTVSPEGDEFEPPPTEESAAFERIPLPWFIKRRLMKAFLRDVHHYQFNSKSTPRSGETYLVQDEIRRRVVETLTEDANRAGNGVHVVVAHSMGTVISYDCLKSVSGCPGVDGLITLGSPLGLDEIQDGLKPGWTRADGYPSEKLAGRWANFYDRLDPVAGLDPKVANDYMVGGKETVIDVNEQSHGKWRHDVTKYLGGERMRGELASMLGVTWS